MQRRVNKRLLHRPLQINFHFFWRDLLDQHKNKPTAHDPYIANCTVYTFRTECNEAIEDDQDTFTFLGTLEILLVFLSEC